MKEGKAVTNKMDSPSDIRQGEIIIYQAEDGNTRIAELT